VQTAVSSGNGIYQAISGGTVAGKIYFAEADMTHTSGTIGLYVVDSGFTTIRATPSVTLSSSGKLLLVWLSQNSDDAIYVRAATTISDFLVDNISVREVLFDQPDGTLTLFNHPTNIPRIEYDSDGNRLGLLVEEERTNLVTYSEDFSNAAWSKYYSIAVTPSNETSPDGQTNAYELSNINSTDADIGLTDNLSASPSTTYTGSIWVKAKTTSDVGKYIKIRLKRSGGTFVASDTVVQLSDSWVRHSVTVTLLADNTGVGFTVTRDNGTPEADRADECLIYGAQLEVGSFPTSYIPTSGSTATRSADVASIGVSEFGYNQSEGTVVVEFQNTEINSTDRMVSINDGSGNNAYQIQHVNGASTSGRIRVGATDYMFSNRTAISSGKAALLYSEEYAQFATDGSANSQDTTVATATMTSLNIGHINGASQCNGHIKSLRYFPRKLTASQLEALTS
jgi:hypothetical protein